MTHPTTYRLLLFALLAPLWAASTVNGQSRSLREQLSRRTARTAGSASATASTEVGSVTGRERYIRRNRQRTAFVGRDLQELSSFVGELQGSTSGQVRTSVSTLQVRLQRNANLSTQRTNQTTRGINEPPLRIGFTVVPPAPEVLNASLTEALNGLSRLHRIGPLSVRVDERRATLQGVVGSAEDRQLAEAYLQFEPGVSEVVNRLTIQLRP